MPRVYSVEDDTSLTLVIAESQTQALNHVVKTKYKVAIASSMDVVDYMGKGGVVETAGATPSEEETPAG